jgi:hypothetical protein
MQRNVTFRRKFRSRSPPDVADFALPARAYTNTRVEHASDYLEVVVKVQDCLSAPAARASSARQGVVLNQAILYLQRIRGL